MDQYYIDMELCALNLEEFIRGGVRNAFGSSRYLDLGYNNEELECFTLHSVMDHIASGLKFIHSRDKMHRDLKPRNGG